MAESRKTLRRAARIGAILLLLGVCAFIFARSAESREVSASRSGGVAEKVAPAVVPDYAALTEPEKKAEVRNVEKKLRSAAHAGEFFVLGACGALTALSFFDGKKKRDLLTALGALLFCLLYAVSDEVHQIFVPGRAFEWGDIALDAAGSILGAALAYGLLPIPGTRKSFLFFRRKKGRAGNRQGRGRSAS